MKKEKMLTELSTIRNVSLLFRNNSQMKAKSYSHLVPSHVKHRWKSKCSRLEASSGHSELFKNLTACCTPWTGLIFQWSGANKQHWQHVNSQAWKGQVLRLHSSSLLRVACRGFHGALLPAQVPVLQVKAPSGWAVVIFNVLFPVIYVLLEGELLLWVRIVLLDITVGNRYYSVSWNINSLSSRGNGVTGAETELL